VREWTSESYNRSYINEMISRHCVGSERFFLRRVDFVVKEVEEPRLSIERFNTEAVVGDEREASDVASGFIGGPIERPLDFVCDCELE
jgi:hypothetical protein